MKVLILTPLGNSTHHEFTQSMAATYRALPDVDWVHTPAVSDVAGARNHLLAIFLQTTASIALWIDSDQSWTPRCIEAVTLPIKRGEAELVTGFVAYKRPGPLVHNVVFWPGDRDSTGYTGERHELDDFRYGRVMLCGTGFWAMSRAAIMAAKKIVPTYRGVVNNRPVGQLSAVFEQRIIDGERYGEDCGAGKSFNTLGLDIWLALDTRIKHYDGNLGYGDGEPFDLDEHAKHAARDNRQL